MSVRGRNRVSGGLDKQHARGPAEYRWPIERTNNKSGWGEGWRGLDKAIWGNKIGQLPLANLRVGLRFLLSNGWFISTSWSNIAFYWTILKCWTDDFDIKHNNMYCWFIYAEYNDGLIVRQLLFNIYFETSPVFTLRGILRWMSGVGLVWICIAVLLSKADDSSENFIN